MEDLLSAEQRPKQKHRAGSGDGTVTDYFTRWVDKIQVALLIEQQKQSIDEKKVRKGAWLEVLKQSQDKETIQLAERFEDLPHRVQEVVKTRLEIELKGIR